MAKGAPLNVGSIMTAVLLVACLELLVTACTLTEWTSHPLLRLGLWQSCVRVDPADDFGCVPFHHPSSFLAVTQILAVSAIVTTFVAGCLSLVALTVRKTAGTHLAVIGSTAVSFALQGAACGCWLGLHGPYGRAGASVGASWIMAAISGLFLLLATGTAAWGWRTARAGGAAAGATYVEMESGWPGEGPGWDPAAKPTAIPEQVHAQALLPPLSP